MSWVLGLDTTSVELGVGLYHEGAAVCGYSRYVRNSHAEHIDSMVGHLLESNGIGAADIDLAGIAVGPGSFTGLRIGISFMKGFFFSRAVRVLPVSSLEGLAVAWCGTDGERVVAFDARQGQAFHARFRCGNGVVTRVTDDKLTGVEELRAQLEGNETVIVDRMGYAKSTILDKLSGAGAVCPVESLAVLRGLACARLAATRPVDAPDWSAPIDVLPRYLQDSRAEARRLERDSVAAACPAEAGGAGLPAR